MKYVAFLRGVNVGGKNLMAMAALKACLEKAGLANVRTVIQSGNVIFESGEKSAATLTKRIESAVAKTLGIESRIVVLSLAQLKTVVADAPAAWKRRTDLRRNVALLRHAVTAGRVLRDVEVKPGVDSVSAGKGVLYLSTVMSDLGKSALPKLVGKPVYREMTIRTVRHVSEDSGDDGQGCSVTPFNQHDAACRCEWGVDSLDALERADVVIVVDVLIPLLEDGAFINVR